MEELIREYPKSQLSDECFLDGRYFNLVLADFKGLIPHPLVVDLHDFPDISEKNEDNEYDWSREFHAGIAVGKDVEVDFDIDIQVMRVVIEIGRKEAHGKKAELQSRHSNLLVFDHFDKAIVRFEPNPNYDYFEVIDDMLEGHFNKLLPDYTYEVSKHHPQSTELSKCKSRGMCMAYVTKVAVLTALGLPTKFSEDMLENENDVRRFAKAIELRYALQLTGEPDIEYGFSLAGGLVGGVLGGVLSRSWTGALLGGAIGGVVGGSGYRGRYVLSPPYGYYGYGRPHYYRPRFLRRRYRYRPIFF